MWQFVMPSFPHYRFHSFPAIGPDGAVYIGSIDNRQPYLYAVDSNGTLRWRFWPRGLGGFPTPPVVGSDGTIYAGSYDKYLYAIRPDGTLKWQFEAGDGLIHSAPAIASDGTVYVGSQDKYLYAIRPDGTLKWKSRYGGILATPAIASDGTVYVGSQDKYLYAIRPDGTLKWQFEAGVPIYSSPAIGRDGTVYLANGDKYLYSISPNGTLKWRFQTAMHFAEASSSPAIGSDGTIYVGSVDCYIYAIRPDGTLKWKYKTECTAENSSPSIGSDGTLYVLCGGLYAFGEERESSTITCRLSKDSIRSGEGVMIHGEISTQVCSVVNILLSSDGLNWYPLTSLVSEPNGSYAYTWNNVSVGIFSIRALSPGDEKHGGASSPTVTLIAKGKSMIDLKARKLILTKGENAEVFGSIIPSLASTNIMIIYRKPDGITIAQTAKTDDAGMFSNSMTTDAMGEWEVEAIWLGTESFEGSNTSVTMTVLPSISEMTLAVVLIIGSALFIALRRRKSTLLASHASCAVAT
jgi:outer membrane protein assembly factor BamB